MTPELTISGYVYISNNAVYVNEQMYHKTDKGLPLKDFLKELYAKIEIGYPKFFKMDALCQLAILGSELLLKETNLQSRHNNDKIALVLSNAAASLDTDRKYHQTIQSAGEYYPSPATFVYTLPSIMSGEIAIKTGITGENNFFIFNQFNPGWMTSYLSSLLQSTTSDAAIGGWTNVDDNNYELFIFTIEPKNNSYLIPFDNKELKNLYFKFSKPS